MASPSPLQRELVRLLDYPTEDLSTEIKDWLDLGQRAIRADLARELIALANHGGGYVLFGFVDDTSGWPTSGPCPHDLAHYSQDEINNVLKAHAEPAFECYTHHLSSTAGNDHVVIQVPGGHLVPIRSRGGPAGSRLTDHTYYIRRPGPESAPPQSGGEWQALMTRCVDNNVERQLESFRRIVGVLQGGPEVARLIADAADPVGATLKRWSDDSIARLQELGEHDA